MLCQIWLKLAQWIWRRRLFFNLVNVFSLFRNYLPLEKGEVLHLNKLGFPSPKECFVGWNWPSGSGEKDETVKSLRQRQQNEDIDNDGQRTNQKSSIEPLAQVSQKERGIQRLWGFICEEYKSRSIIFQLIFLSFPFNSHMVALWVRALAPQAKGWVFKSQQLKQVVTAPLPNARQ